jgi:hypothetical protein
VNKFYTICSPGNLYWNHAGNDTYNVMSATWFDTASEAGETLADLDVDYKTWRVQEHEIIQLGLT